MMCRCTVPPSSDADSMIGHIDCPEHGGGSVTPNPTPDQLRKQIADATADRAHGRIASGLPVDENVYLDAAMDVVAPVLEAQRQEIQAATEVLDRVREALRQPEDSALSMHAARVMAELDEARAEIARLSDLWPTNGLGEDTDVKQLIANHRAWTQQAQERADAAEAEVARLRAQLDSAVLLSDDWESWVDRMLYPHREAGEAAKHLVRQWRRDSADSVRGSVPDRSALNDACNDYVAAYMGDDDSDVDGALDKVRRALGGEDPYASGGSVPATPPDWGSANLEECGDPNCRCARPASSETTPEENKPNG